MNHAVLIVHAAIEPWASCRPEGLKLTLLARDAPATEVAAYTLLDNEEVRFELQPVRGTDGTAWQRWQGTVPWSDSGPNQRYVFRACTADRVLWLGSAGARSRPPPLAEHFRIAREPITPAWAREQVLYQIFPDRFARGQSGPVRGPAMVYGSSAQPSITLDWGAPVPTAEHGRVFYGGDLAGIVQRLDYLQGELGVTAIYLTPVFHAQSNHRYDTQDYEHVDPMLGGDAALVALADGLRARGMRLLLDAVLNHTGANHPWINRWGQHAVVGAAQSRESPWYGWYARDESAAIVGWNGHASLPVLDYANDDVMQALVAGPDSVLRRWLRPPVAADGWRLDAVHMVGEGLGAQGNSRVVRAIRAAVKSERPDALVLGEHFAQADAWLQGDREDGTMNYWGFTRPLWAWLAGRDFAGRTAPIEGPEFTQWIVQAAAAVPHEVQLSSWNLIDSHDVPRLLSVLHDDIDRLRAAVMLQFVWPGVPCIYYGDEIGLQGASDPDNRRCFPWARDEWRQDVFALYRSAIGLRKARDELRHGAAAVLACGDDWIAVARYSSDAATVCIVARRGLPADVAVPLRALPFDAARWSVVAGPWQAGANGGVQDDAVRARFPRAGALVIEGTAVQAGVRD
jgi:alpha-glucosidase